MKTSKYSESQIATALRQVAAGAPIAEVSRSLGVSEVTYCHWRKKYGQMAGGDPASPPAGGGESQTEAADLTLDKVILQEVLAKKA